VRGRSHVPTEESRRVVRGLAGLGMIVDDVARLAGITENTLRKHYTEEMAVGRAEANVRVSRALFQAATKAERPNVIAQMFWLKNRAGWKDIGAPPGGSGATSLRIEFVQAAPSRPEPPTIEAEPAVIADNSHARAPRSVQDGADGTFGVEFGEC